MHFEFSHLPRSSDAAQKPCDVLSGDRRPLKCVGLIVHYNNRRRACAEPQLPGLLAGHQGEEIVHRIHTHSPAADAAARPCSAYSYPCRWSGPPLEPQQSPRPGGQGRREDAKPSHDQEVTRVLRQLIPVSNGFKDMQDCHQRKNRSRNHKIGFHSATISVARYFSKLATVTLGEPEVQSLPSARMRAEKYRRQIVLTWGSWDNAKAYYQARCVRRRWRCFL
jgi:hypothetical protein